MKTKPEYHEALVVHTKRPTNKSLYYFLRGSSYEECEIALVKYARVGSHGEIMKTIPPPAV